MQGLSLSQFVVLLIAGLGGTLACVLLATTITGERLHRVYDLFLVRPVRPVEILLSRYLALLTVLAAAVVSRRRAVA